MFSHMRNVLEIKTNAKPDEYEESERISHLYNLTFGGLLRPAVI